MEKVLQLWLLQMLLLLTSAWFAAFTKLFCLLNKLLRCWKSNSHDNYKLRNTRTMTSSICTAEPLPQMPPDLERIFFSPASSRSKGKHPTTKTERSCLMKTSQWCKQKYPSGAWKQFWITTCMSFQETKQNYGGTSYLPQNSELNWKHHTRWKSKATILKTEVSDELNCYFSLCKPWRIRMTNISYQNKLQVSPKYFILYGFLLSEHQFTISANGCDCSSGMNLETDLQRLVARFSE